jgi:hypothetical protein
MGKWTTPYGAYRNAVDAEIYPEGRPRGADDDAVRFKAAALKRLRAFVQRHFTPVMGLSADALTRAGQQAIQQHPSRSATAANSPAIAREVVARWGALRPILAARSAEIERDLAADLRRAARRRPGE